MQITIPQRFCGPPASGNGGYTCGKLAAFVGNPAEITLRAPPPLETKLRVEQADGHAQLWDGDTLLGEARALKELALDVPRPPRWDEAVAASKGFNGLRDHAYATCFVCGPQRAARDGMRIFCGPWRDGLVAGIWVPDPTLDDGRGFVPPEIVWSAIDCPGEWAVVGRDDPDAPIRGVPSTVLLGRLAGQVHRSLRIGEACTVIGWCLGIDGRKYHVGAAVHTRAGELVAASRATWVLPKG